MMGEQKIAKGGYGGGNLGGGGTRHGAKVADMAWMGDMVAGHGEFADMGMAYFQCHSLSI